jgi:anaerobic magnesium-protoporphyrin IX monomethyl ester cyclase
LTAALSLPRHHARRATRILLVRCGRATLSHYNITYPMGLLYLAAAARRDHGAEVRLVDGRFPWNGRARIAHELADLGPDIIGLSALTLHARELHEAAALARAVAPRTLIVAGGPHPSVFPDQVLRDPNVDAVVVGEGERPFGGIVSRLASGERNLSGIPGVRTRAVPRGEPGVPVDPLDDLAVPAWDLVDPRAYAVWPSMAPVGIRRQFSLVTSRGCPFGCIYCHRSHGRRFRPHSAERVLDEIARLARGGRATDFEVVDDVFNLDRDRVLAITEGVLRLGLRVRFQFPNGLRSDRLDAELLGLLRRAGTNWISYAVETGSPRLQRLLRKRLDLDLASRAIRDGDRLGIFGDGFFMLGLPTETEAEAAQTVRFACDSELHSAKFFTALAFPGTEMHARYSGEEAPALFRSYDYYFTEKNLSSIPDERLPEIVNGALRSFFRSPRRIGRILRAHPMPLTLPFYAAAVTWRGLLASRRSPVGPRGA